MKYIGFKHQRENKQDSDNSGYSDNVQRFDYICDSCTFSMLKHVKLDKNKDLSYLHESKHVKKPSKVIIYHVYVSWRI
jgi:hypothetical protein